MSTDGIQPTFVRQSQARIPSRVRLLPFGFWKVVAVVESQRVLWLSIVVVCSYVS
jgi:hypothetical protein